MQIRTAVAIIVAMQLGCTAAILACLADDKPSSFMLAFFAVVGIFGALWTVATEGE